MQAATPPLAVAAERDVGDVGDDTMLVRTVEAVFTEAPDRIEALAWLRGVVDFSSDLRPRQY